MHQHLAVAYTRVGQPAEASEDLAALASHTGDDIGLAKLRTKLDRAMP